MYKEVPFAVESKPSLRLNRDERLLVRHVHTEYLGKKFFQPFSGNEKTSLKFQKLERCLSLRTHLLYFYCNPLYKQPFDSRTVNGLFEKLALYETALAHELPKGEASQRYYRKVSELPVFLAGIKMKEPVHSPDLQFLYTGILDRENLAAIKPGAFAGYWEKISTLFGIMGRLPFVYLVRKIKFSNSVVSRYRHVDNIDGLWNTINKLFFPVNYLVFRKGIRESISGKTELADLSVLMMLIGDELIDRVAQNTGSQTIVELLSRHNYPYTIKINEDFTLDSGNLEALYEMLNIENGKRIDTYDLTFEQLYKVLIEIRSDINLRLLKFEPIRRKKSSEAIVGFLNYCLSTFMDDLLFSTFAKSKKHSHQHTRWYYRKKNHFVMMYGLWLRSVLLDKDYTQYLSQVREWGHLVENIQLYDDLKDMKTDWDFQPNYPLIWSHQYFKDEYTWFEQNMERLSGLCSVDEIVELSVCMPKTVSHILLLSKYMGLGQLSWFTQLATNYSWKQNWTHAFLHYRGFGKSPGYDLAAHPMFATTDNPFTSSSREVNIAFLLLSRTYPLAGVVENREFYFDYLLMLCLHDKHFSRSFYLRTPLSRTFQVVYRFLFMKTGMRTQLLNRYMRTRGAEVRQATELFSRLKPVEDPSAHTKVLDYIRANWL